MVLFIPRLYALNILYICEQIWHVCRRTSYACKHLSILQNPWVSVINGKSFGAQHCDHAAEIHTDLGSTLCGTHPPEENNTWVGLLYLSFLLSWYFWMTTRIAHQCRLLMVICCPPLFWIKIMCFSVWLLWRIVDHECFFTVHERHVSSVNHGSQWFLQG